MRTCLDCPALVSGRYARYCPDCRWRHRGKPAKYVWTAEKDEFLRAKYSPFERRCGERIARIWGWPGWVVKKRAAMLGLTAGNWKTRGIAPWSPDEERLLLNHAGRRHPQWMARKLGRTLTAVTVKLKRLGLSQKLDGYSARDVALGFGVDVKTVTRWVERGWLRTESRGPARVDWRITDAAITDFIREHRTAYQLGKVDQVWFLDYALGPMRVELERAS